MTEAKKRFLLRPWVRAIHRDVGYLAVGLTLVLLGLYVLGTLLRQGTSFVPRSRGFMRASKRTT